MSHKPILAEKLSLSKKIRVNGNHNDARIPKQSDPSIDVSIKVLATINSNDDD